MTLLIELLPLLLAGLLCVTIIDTAGAYASRRFNFNYGYLAVLSFIVYVLLAYVVSKKAGLNEALLVNLTVGFYDATIGFKISRALKANTGLSNEQLQSMTVSFNLKVMLAVSVFFTFIGYALS